MKKLTLLFVVMFISSIMFAQFNANSNAESSPNASTNISSAKGAWQVQFNYTGIPSAGSAGCETDGNFYYLAQWSGSLIWKLNMSGVLVDSFSIAGVTGLRDLAYDGTYFYGGKNTNVIYKMNFSSTPPSLVSTITCPSGFTVRNICYEPDSNALWVGGWATDLSLVNMSGTVLRTIPATTHGLTSTYGTAYDNVTPGGPYIWAINAASTVGVITQLHATTGMPTGLSHTCSDVGTAIGGGLFIQPGIVTGTVTLGGLLQNEALFGYNLASVIPDTFDLGVNTIDIPNLCPIGTAVTIDGEIGNIGLATITSFDLNYRVDGGTVNTDHLTGVSIAPFGTYNYAHTTTWNPTAGAHVIEVWTSNPNGHADQYKANDSLSTNAVGYDPASAVQRLPLFEGFTSSTCGPCVAGNTNLASVFGANPNKFTCVKYQMSWPGAGDPYYTLEGYARRVLYNVSSVPHLMVDGGWDGNTSSYSSALLNTAYNEPSFMAITADYAVGGNVVEVNVSVDPKIAFPAGLKLHIAVIENETFNNTGSNGETEFHYVMKKMLPDANGTTLSALSPGTPYTDMQHYEFKGSYRLPANASTPINHATEHSVENFNNLNVVVWVQDHNTKMVLQSAFATKVAGISEKPSGNGIIELFPNPANDQTSVRYLLNENQNVNVQVYNILGELVYTKNNGTESSGIHTTTINTSGISEGLYIVKLTIGNNVYTQKLNIN